MKIRFLKGHDYIQLFNFSTGQALMLEKNSFSYRKEGPLLLDVSITNRCERQCDFCYRNSKSFGYDMPLEDYTYLLSQAKQCGVQQLAIGGGEPTLHPQFVDILKLTSENGIIPNYSTNGDSLSDEILVVTKKYCGAIAVSIYGDINNYKEIITRLINYKIKINLHIILTRDSILKHLGWLKNPPEWLRLVNAIIFLNFKPANGRKDLCLNQTPKEILEEFFSIVQKFNTCGIGFDTCSVSFVSNYMKIDSSLFDYCEAARKSAYINEKLLVYPCSFYTANGLNLKHETLFDIWNKSKTFINHREQLSKQCSKCKNFKKCHFGCLIYDINNCNLCKN